MLRYDLARRAIVANSVSIYFRDFLHILNFVGLLLFLPLIEAIGNMVVAKIKEEQQAASSECRTEEEKSLRSNNNQQQQEVKSSESFTKENFLRRKLSDERFHLRLLAPSTFLLHFANSLCSLFLIFHQKWRRRKQFNSISIYEQDPVKNPLKSSKDEEMSKEVEWSLHMQHGKSSKDEEEVEKEGSAFQMTLIAAKIFSVSVASAITYAILVHSQDSVLDMELTYR